MKKYLMKRFALTEKGAADMLKAILATTLTNIALMTPVWLLFVFTGDYLDGADKIVVLSDGTVSEEGSPKNLLSRKDSAFHRMARLQAASADWSI